ncbi:hypothetical protein E2C01_092072 [Portunus trituberculatus]|uniref:Uncharacterized protein n=1 Tax=Portunus trituberculatus TaxID=210409 RepID=A0A5B7JWS8_PORTR|nr:hypothetical protein [Portunus trituberculatus]
MKGLIPAKPAKSMLTKTRTFVTLVTRGAIPQRRHRSDLRHSTASRRLIHAATNHAGCLPRAALRHEVTGGRHAEVQSSGTPVVAVPLKFP